MISIVPWGLADGNDEEPYKYDWDFNFICPGNIAISCCIPFASRVLASHTNSTFSIVIAVWLPVAVTLKIKFAILLYGWSLQNTGRILLSQ